MTGNNQLLLVNECTDINLDVLQNIKHQVALTGLEFICDSC